MISKSKNSSEFFKSNGRFRENKPDLYPLEKVFHDAEVSVSQNMIKLLNSMIKIDPKERFDYEQIIDFINNLNI
jgi:hypothetical protein